MEKTVAKKKPPIAKKNYRGGGATAYSCPSPAGANDYTHHCITVQCTQMILIFITDIEYRDPRITPKRFTTRGGGGGSAIHDPLTPPPLSVQSPPSFFSGGGS